MNGEASEPKILSEQQLKWRIEQLKCLVEEKQSLDRYMWQIPVAILGAVALLLNGLKGATEYLDASGARVLVLLGAVFSLYGASVLQRLHVRREAREQRIRELEELVRLSTVSVVFGTDYVSRAIKDSHLWQKVVGRMPTTRLGVLTLLIVAGAFFLFALFLRR